MGVTGGIACYKAADVVSRLKKEGIGVDVIMTKNACHFVDPLTFRHTVEKSCGDRYFCYAGGVEGGACSPGGKS